MQTRLRFAGAVALAAWLGFASMASASLRVSDDALARSSAAAVQGRVVATSAHWDAAADTIYTFVTIDVAQSWGLDAQPARVVVKQLGGLVGGTAFVVGGQARFTVGEDVLVFLDVRPRDGTLSVSGLEQGKWVLNGAADVATSAVREMRGTDPAAVVARDYRTTTALQSLAALVGSRARATGAVLEPAVPVAAGGGHDTPLYTLLSSTPARWHEADTSTPVYVDTQAGGHPQFAGGGLTQLSNAAALWSAAGSLRLTNGVSRTARCFSNSENDGRLSVTYGDPCNEIADASSTLAIGGAYYSSSPQRTINGVTYWRITKGMIVTDNPTSKFSGFTTGCYEEMLVHELGHAIGFGHAAARPAIMYPSISSGCFSRVVSAPLGADDLAGMAAVYPGTGAPPATTPPGTPINLTATASGSTVNISWTASSSGGAATGYQLLAGTAPGVTNIGVVPLTAPGLSVPNVPNGTYYVRVVATNAAGASAPTADQSVTVGAAAPGAPRSLTGVAGAGGFVSLSWLAPSSGPAPTGYVVLAGFTPGANTFQIPLTATGLAGSGVGAGVYYVRVVALNGATPGPASNELTLVVP